MNDEPKKAAQCDGCKYFRHGQCRRSAPPVSGEVWAYWPRVADFDWCGEWQDKREWQ